MNKYLQIQKEFQNEITKIIKEIFDNYDNVLELKIEEVNLLQREDNCVESSTALGFLIEEFLVNKLITKTKVNEGNYNKILVKRDSLKKTQNSSFDFYSYFNHHLFLVNIKSVLKNNDAVASINQLHKDYVLNYNENTKHFMLLKIFYTIQKSKIKINNIKSFFLEEVDFSKGYMSYEIEKSFNNAF
ncbi:UpaP162 family type II restriction enzyme [Mycoplasma anserisalpingitidis]|uniref:Restriction endonuclease n=1 Tax=Mycoplasma anserisalpingitidis TaxID=519450 RepID=A0A5B8K5R7_9MOLU|nr:hypothetical protein [Mycoplasma anserisalpingitidis]QDY88355.1 hypothetical protein FOY43_01600 [Mycoplasma anserisalpingitidis]